MLLLVFTYSLIISNFDPGLTTRLVVTVGLIETATYAFLEAFFHYSTGESTERPIAVLLEVNGLLARLPQHRIKLLPRIQAGNKDQHWKYI